MFLLVMGGSGSATVNLSLKMDDNPNIKGDSCRSVRIGDVELKRTIIGAEEEADPKEDLKRKNLSMEREPSLVERDIKLL